MAEDNSDFLLFSEPEKPFRTRMMERFKSQPFLVVGWVGTLGALMYGAYRYKTKGPSLKTSLFLVQLRVFAQGAIVSSLMLGMIHQMYLEHTKSKEKIQKD